MLSSGHGNRQAQGPRGCSARGAGLALAVLGCSRSEEAHDRTPSLAGARARRRLYGVAGRGGLISDSDFQLWIDWMIEDGALEPGQLRARELYTNDLNP